MGPPLKLRLVQLSAVAGLALAAAPSLAQPSEAGSAAGPVVPRVAQQAVQVAAAGVKPADAALTVKARRVAAAGSVFYVMDGVVVHATYAPALAPAAGFVYER